MCGFAGYVGTTLKKPSKKKILKCLAALNKRGPDNNDFKEYNTAKKTIQFTHTRLSIIDLSKESNQPFEDEDGSLIFNGMIYNYIELKELLKKKKIRFNTNSDTEVLLKMLNYFGSNALGYLDGMWSFAYYSKNSSRILLCRDRFGEKPLYFSKLNQNIFFGNSIKAISSIYPKKIKFNEKKIEEYLKYPDKSIGLNNKTLFKNIESVDPGTFVEINLKNSKFKKTRYWNLKTRKSNISYAQAKKKIKEIIIETLKTRVRSDVKNCILLSGGLDSNAIASVIKRKKSIEAYSLVSSNKKYDERKYIKLGAKMNKIKSHLISSKNPKSYKILKDLIDNSFNIVPATTSLGFAILCEKIKKDKNKVILTGAGGDEIFAGYYVNFLAQILSFKGIKKTQKLLFWKKNIEKFIRNPLLKNFNNKRLLQNSQRLNFFIEEDGTINKFFLNKNKLKIKNYFKDPFYNNMFQNLFCQSIPAQNLQYDLVAMNYSLETRAPFLSHKLAEYVYSLKKDYFMFRGKTKSLLRDSIKNLVHKKIVNNYEKTGFYSPFKSFFNRGDYTKVIKKILASNLIFKFVVKEKLKKLLNKKSADISHIESKLLFACLNVAVLENTINNYD